MTPDPSSVTPLKPFPAKGYIMAGGPRGTGAFPAPGAVFSLRKGFPEAWAGFLHDALPSAGAVSEAFAVDGKTGRDWWHGRAAPSGFAVALAFRAAPAIAARWLTDLGGWLTRRPVCRG